MISMLVLSFFLFFFGNNFAYSASADSIALEKLWVENIARYPGLRSSEVKYFYSEHAPELIKELALHCEEHPKLAAAFIRQLIEYYQDLLRIKRENSTLYGWRLDKMKSEIVIRRLGFEIKILNEKAANINTLDKIMLKRELDKKKKELQKLLEESFIETEQQQKIEINRLEAELNILKQLMQERKANKQMILQERFQKLIGEKAEN